MPDSECSKWPWVPQERSKDSWKVATLRRARGSVPVLLALSLSLSLSLSSFDLLGHRPKGKLAKGWKERKNESGRKDRTTSQAEAAARKPGRKEGRPLKSVFCWNLEEQNRKKRKASLVRSRSEAEAEKKDQAAVNFCHVIGSLSIGSDDDT